MEPFINTSKTTIFTILCIITFMQFNLSHGQWEDEDGSYKSVGTEENLTISFT
ncbi:hypothetical protein Bhyg_13519 [Pseudolycoriella hygida]|uniref:Uncharacterized protein n=1 Tax=Pseudolycoriella hygida TaxID=35572 RepID=A0A9Q0MN00_9DIPT|nr:hypothetical protein Bhyg_13519 [Pseudolycoriella hygida]